MTPLVAFTAGIVVGVVVVTLDDLVVAWRQPVNPHCEACAKLVHRCRCSGGPV